MHMAGGGMHGGGCTGGEGGCTCILCIPPGYAPGGTYFNFFKGLTEDPYSFCRVICSIANIAKEFIAPLPTERE